MKKATFIIRTIFLLGTLLLSCNLGGARPIDRRALVNRHLPRCTRADSLSTFTVGNGEFAFSVDVTGLQTLTGYYEQGIPLSTLSDWGWHSVPNIHGYRREQTLHHYDAYGRLTPYASDMDSDAARYFRANPHRLHLGHIGFKKIDANDQITVEDISGIDQVMDIWNGVVKSSFVLQSARLHVETCVHPERDQVATSIRSDDLTPGALGIGFDFYYGSCEWGKIGYDADLPERHSTRIVDYGTDYLTLERRLDSTTYFVNIRWRGDAQMKQLSEHSYLLVLGRDRRWQLTCHFSDQRDFGHDRASAVFRQAARHWQRFWRSGGAIDLSASSHPQAVELERRIVLSQYLTAVNCSGSLPPQETGLTANSWFGKFHLEMHWWHAAHFALWGRPELLEKSLPWYEAILPVARQKAVDQGYDGVRWPKMTCPEGHDSPSSIGVFLIWQQPHPIYFAELLYRLRTDRKTLERYAELVFRSAEFMASYAHWDARAARYVLGPTLIPAQEIYHPEETINPAFELSYWAYGLETAQRWCERLGLQRRQAWDDVLHHLAPLPIDQGYYQNVETFQNTLLEAFHRRDHPSVLAAFGMIPHEAINLDAMRRTLEAVLETWDWRSAWGWDFPMTAMTAARVGRPDLAVQALLMPTEKNTYLNNGHNYQSPRLPLYLPGNGGLLAAVAMMAAGWDGAPAIPAPGFPKDDLWNVKCEGIQPLP